MKGAFTGANRDHKGLFEAANGGTIFLDEIGDIPLSTQVRLLRVLQEGEIKRVGATDPVKVDVRVIAATNRDLPKLVRAGKFREDLFYRLNVIAIPLPPLRERLDDVPLLAHHFLRRYSDRLGKKVRTLAPQAIELLCGYRWPGNVRELENAIERAVVLCRGDSVQPTDLPPSVTGRTAPVLREAAARATTPSCSPRATPPPRTARCATSRSATSRRSCGPATTTSPRRPARPGWTAPTSSGCCASTAPTWRTTSRTTPRPPEAAASGA